MVADAGRAVIESEEAAQPFECQPVVLERRRRSELLIPFGNPCLEKKHVLGRVTIQVSNGKVAVLLEHDVRGSEIVMRESEAVEMLDASQNTGKAVRARSLIHRFTPVR